MVLHPVWSMPEKILGEVSMVEGFYEFLKPGVEFLVWKEVEVEERVGGELPLNLST